MTRALDLGCGLRPRNHFNATESYGIDVRTDVENRVVQADLVIDPIPYGDALFDYVTAFDFLEHVPRILYAPRRRNPFVEIMNEIWRVLRNEGLFLSFTPAFPHGPAFRDPTHVNIITEETFPLYFGNGYRWASMYGFTGNFDIVSQEWQGPHLVSLLKKVPV